MKRFLQITSAISVLSLCFFMIAPQAFAEADVSSTAISLDLATGSVEIYESEGVTYCVQNGDTQATTGGVILRQTASETATANTVTVSNGSCKMTVSGLNMEGNYPFKVKETSTLELTLVGNSLINGMRSVAIWVPANAGLTIGGSGSIVAKSDEWYAGIGSDYNGTVGTITINGGNVVAIGGSYGAGIGGSAYSDGGKITINGGTINATGGECGAGIGGGYQGASGTIIINGGTVTATTGGGGAGIGGGARSVFDASNSDIIINGGTITAIGSGGAGIGGGGGGGICNSITINGGTVTATNIGVGADIGASYLGTCKAVTISPNVALTNGDGDAPTVEETIFIDKQPLSSAAHLNNTPISAVEARNHSGLSYQWEISTDNTNWNNLEGEISSVTNVFVLREDLNGCYLRCKLTNGWGNVEYTDSVKIYIIAFEKQPTNVEANLNDVVAFETLSVCVNVIYQWQRSYDEGATWSDIAGENFSTLIVNATLSESNARYRCVITATNGDQLISDVVSVNLDLGDLVTYTVQDFKQEVDGSYTMTSQQVLEGLSGTTVTAPEDGYDGFTMNTDQSNLSGTVAEDNSLVLTRYFDRETYSITFDTNGGSALPDLEALYGASIEAPSAPTRYGKVFDGWYADANLTEQYIFDTMPLNGTTVYAKWIPVGANRGIEYNINGLAIRDDDTFELLDEIPDGNFLAEVSVTNLDAAETDTIMLVYYTDAGQMIGINYMFANTPIGYTATFGAAVDNTGGNISIIRAFVLPSLGNPIPLAESKSIGQ